MYVDQSSPVRGKRSWKKISEILLPLFIQWHDSKLRTRFLHFIYFICGWQSIASCVCVCVCLRMQNGWYIIHNNFLTVSTFFLFAFSQTLLVVQNGIFFIEKNKRMWVTWIFERFSSLFAIINSFFSSFFFSWFQCYNKFGWCNSCQQYVGIPCNGKQSKSNIRLFSFEMIVMYFSIAVSLHANFTVYNMFVYFVGIYSVAHHATPRHAKAKVCSFQIHVCSRNYSFLHFSFSRFALFVPSKNENGRVWRVFARSVAHSSMKYVDVDAVDGMKVLALKVKCIIQYK